MMKKVLSIILVAILAIIVTGCGKNENNEQATSNSKNGPILESEHFKIEGIYLDESFQDDNLGLVYLFYTIKAGEENLEISSSTTKIKINDKNSYDSTVDKDFIPTYTNHYYGDIIKKYTLATVTKCVQILKLLRAI